MNSLDISMCKNEKCTLKENCFRYKAIPRKVAQSYTDFKQNEDGTCDYYKPINK